MERVEEMDHPVVKQALQEFLRDAYEKIDAEIFFRSSGMVV